MTNLVYLGLILWRSSAQFKIPNIYHPSFHVWNIADITKPSINQFFQYLPSQWVQNNVSGHTVFPLHNDPHRTAIQTGDVNGVLLGTSPVKNTRVWVNSNVKGAVLSLIGHDCGYLSYNNQCIVCQFPRHFQFDFLNIANWLKNNQELITCNNFKTFDYR